jgi:hypothetical protein
MDNQDRTFKVLDFFSPEDPIQSCRTVFTSILLPISHIKLRDVAADPELNYFGESGSGYALD